MIFHVVHAAQLFPSHSHMYFSSGGNPVGWEMTFRRVEIASREVVIQWRSGFSLTSPTNWWYNGGIMGIYTIIFLGKMNIPKQQPPSTTQVWGKLRQVTPETLQGFHSIQKDRMYNVRLIIHQWHMFFFPESFRISHQILRGSYRVSMFFSFNQSLVSPKWLTVLRNGSNYFQIQFMVLTAMKFSRWPTIV